ncbi:MULTISPECIES: hypothetical protein [Pseudonocardia]|uniref:DUF3817 domain-containing protein n=2 Tax=Pseudonocardia TaxID=1847 RepID=A0A1Y2MMN6_PSEAH|nr:MULTISPECIES: hypothetical protein [Pseudonocardia]OSY36249.1 hypothetical protein BG845_05499 [Pseudonocardia autotrophica]TDN73057.1 hypothetical protein C8E95_2128 [Pseudonocardia autotrophica]BBG03775.1 hypothetical protein Pdca_49840 [Pseudonocardia autotrophica]GEC26617.1 hypothetical protein PSA01_36460 [Pseudonocardia saturnea]
MPGISRDATAERGWLAVASVVETVSLALLLLNLATVHLPGVASVLGPVHGLAYLVTIAVTCLMPTTVATRLLSAVPAVGGLLVLRRTRSSVL